MIVRRKGTHKENEHDSRMQRRSDVGQKDEYHFRGTRPKGQSEAKSAVARGGFSIPASNLLPTLQPRYKRQWRIAWKYLALVQNVLRNSSLGVETFAGVYIHEIQRFWQLSNAHSPADFAEESLPRLHSSANLAARDLPTKCRRTAAPGLHEKIKRRRALSRRSAAPIEGTRPLFSEGFRRRAGPPRALARTLFVTAGRRRPRKRPPFPIG